VNKCEKSYCYAPDVECDDGLVFRECTHFKADPSTEVTTADTDLQASSFSWTNVALGMHDVAKFATRSRIATVALIGTSNAGKTSFLATLYLLLLNGKTLDGYKFAGSFTLGGWEILANKMRWLGHEPPSFPDHTPRGIARQPGLLHLALRDEKDRLCDVVFADAPGEWFERWAIDRADPQAEGARWLERHADSVLIFLDSEKLSSPEFCGVTRSLSLDLLNRSFDSYPDCSIGIVWAKHDTFNQNQANEALKEYIAGKNIERSFNTISAPVAPESQDVLEAATWSIQQVLEGRKIEAISVPRNVEYPFLTFRGRLA
jgi:Double-GTPase 2